jgi:membrane protein implicated in regulation of membrane protease activity
VLIILAIALLLLLPSPWSFVGFFGVFGLWLVELLLWNRTVKHRRKAVGAQTLIGREAIVSAPCPSGRCGSTARSGPRAATPAPRRATACG